MTAPELRTDSERDVDKFYYTYPFRRLAEITQVSSDRYPVLQHNRMTHSLKVAQVARRLAQYLNSDGPSAPHIVAAGGIDPNVAQAAGMAHDMGHPPFGHIGEEVLDEIARLNGLEGYEGNAQTFRIITNILRHNPHKDQPREVRGMNLTIPTLAATIKYPWPRGPQSDSKRYRKFGFYSDDEPIFTDKVAPFLKKTGGGPSLEAQIMDWADDITYATHDVEDFYTSGLIPLDRLAHKPSTEGEPGEYIAIHPNEFEEFWAYAVTRLGRYSSVPSGEAKRRFQSYAATFPRRPFDGKFSTRARVGSLVSSIITDATAQCTVKTGGRLDRGPEGTMDSTIAILKQFTWYYVIDRPQLRGLQIGQAQKLSRLTNSLVSWAAKAVSRWETQHGQSGEPVRVRLSTDERWANLRELPAVLGEFLTRNAVVTSPDIADDDEMRPAVARAVIDYVSLLTEREVETLHDRIVSGIAV